MLRGALSIHPECKEDLAARVGGALDRDAGTVARALCVLIVAFELHVPHILVRVFVIPCILHKEQAQRSGSTSEDASRHSIPTNSEDRTNHVVLEDVLQ